MCIQLLLHTRLYGKQVLKLYRRECVMILTFFWTSSFVAHAQQGSQYLVCVCVCMYVCVLYFTIHVIICVINNTNHLGGRLRLKISGNLLWKCMYFIVELDHFLLVYTCFNQWTILQYTCIFCGKLDKCITHPHHCTHTIHVAIWIYASSYMYIHFLYI